MGKFTVGSKDFSKGNLPIVSFGYDQINCLQPMQVLLKQSIRGLFA